MPSLKGSLRRKCCSHQIALPRNGQNIYLPSQKRKTAGFNEKFLEGRMGHHDVNVIFILCITIIHLILHIYNSF